MIEYEIKEEKAIKGGFQLVVEIMIKLTSTDDFRKITNEYDDFIDSLVLEKLEHYVEFEENIT